MNSDLEMTKSDKSASNEEEQLDQIFFTQSSEEDKEEIKAILKQKNAQLVQKGGSSTSQAKRDL